MAFRVKKGNEVDRTVYVDGRKFITRDLAEAHKATIRADWQPVVVETDELILPISAESKLTSRQTKTFGPKRIQWNGADARITAEVRFDDHCGNGHNTFSITGDITVPKEPNGGAGGCIHEEITKHFPELAPFIKWHLCSTDDPMHYVANALYFAGDRDCWGTRKGEPRSFDWAVQFGDNPIKHTVKTSFAKFLQEDRSGFDFEVIAVEHSRGSANNDYKFGPKFTFGGFGTAWHECPFDSESEALDFLKALQTCSPTFLKVPSVFGEGKVRELEAARRAAIWPEATDEELTAPDLREKLIARLPALLASFRADVESLGFTW